MSRGTCHPHITFIIHSSGYFMHFQRYKVEYLTKIRLLNCPSNDVCFVTYFQLFHGQIAHTIFELKALVHDHLNEVYGSM